MKLKPLHGKSTEIESHLFPLGETLPSPGTIEVLRSALLLFQGKLPEIFDDLVAHYGEVTRVCLPDYPILRFLARQLTGLALKPYVVVAGPEANRFLMNGDHHTVQRGPIEERGFPLDESGMARNRCLVALDGPEQTYYRRFLFEAFRTACLARYIPLIEECVSYRVQTWDRSVNLFSEMERLAVEICAHTMLGIDLEPSALAEFSDAYWPTTLGVRNKRGSLAKQRMRELLKRLIQQRTRQPGHDALSVLIQSMHEKYPDITHDDLLHYGFMLAEVGQSDIAIFLTCLLAVLALYPDLNERLRVEVAGCSPASLLDCEGAFPLLSGVLREVERLYPPVPYIFRYAAQDIDIGPYHVPGDSWLVSAVYATHRLPGLFQEPLRFDPDRFLPPRNETTSRFAIMGFGAGTHGCIGMQFVRLLAGIVVRMLLPGYQFSLAGICELPRIDYRGRCQKPGKKIILAVTRR